MLPYTPFLNKSKTFTILAASFLFSFVMWGNTLKAKWGLVDDHEIIQTLGPAGKISLVSLPRLLAQTEIMQPGTAQRYRPAYRFLRLLETVVWGDSPALWYGCRIVLFALSVAIVWWILDKYLGFFVSLLSALYIFSFSFWADVWTRLGPAETYAVFGCSLYALGFQNVIHALSDNDKIKSSSLSNWLLMCVGAFVTMGAKENMLALLLFVILLPILLLRKRLLNRNAVIFSSLILVYGTFIGASVATAMSKIGKDIYSNDVAPLQRLELLGKALQTFGNVYVFACLILFGILLSLQLFSPFASNETKDKDRLLKQSVRYSFVLILFVMLYVSQYVFYNGELPNHNIGRYNFPGMLLAPIFVLVTFYFSYKALENKDRARSVLTVVFSLSIAFLIWSNDINKLRKSAQSASQTTKAITEFMVSLSDTLKNDPQAHLVLLSSNAVVDHEPVISIATFLRVKGVSNPIHAALNMNSPQNISNARSALGAKMALDFINLQNNGSKDELRFSPAGAFDKEQKCLKVDFSAPGPELEGCTNIMTIMAGSL